MSAKIYTISNQLLYENFKQPLKYGYFINQSFDDESNNEYYDMFSKGGELVSMDGEDVVLLEQKENYYKFHSLMDTNPDSYFVLSEEEVRQGIFAIRKEDDLMKKEFKNYVNIYEPLLNGEFGDTEPHEYLLESDHKMTNEEFNDIIFQACEIERFSNGNLCVNITIDKNGEYYDSDEIFIKVNLVRTNELSEYIMWEKCPTLPPIYKIDREKSTIEVLE